MFDIVSPQITFLHRQNKRMSTMEGKALSVVLYLIAVVALFFFGQDLVLRNAASTVVTEMKTDSEEKQEDFLHVFEIHSQTSVPIKDLHRKISVRMDYADIDTQRTPIRKGEIVYLVPCQDTKLIKEDRLNISKTFVTGAGQSFCLPDSFNKKVWGVAGSSNFAVYQFYFSICNNKTQNDCYPKDEIEKEFSNLFVFRYLYTDYLLKLDDFENPMQPYLANTAKPITINDYRTFIFEAQPTLIYSNSGIIFNEETNSISYQYLPVLIENGGSRKTDDFILVQVTQSKLKKVFKREYIKIQHILAQVGGILKFFQFAFSVISSYFSRFKQLHDFEENIEQIQENVKFDEKDVSRRIFLETPHLEIRSKTMINSIKNLKLENYLKEVKKKTEEIKLQNFEINKSKFCQYSYFDKISYFCCSFTNSGKFRKNDFLTKEKLLLNMLEINEVFKSVVFSKKLSKILTCEKFTLLENLLKQEGSRINFKNLM